MNQSRAVAETERPDTDPPKDQAAAPSAGTLKAKEMASAGGRKIRHKASGVLVVCVVVVAALLCVAPTVVLAVWPPGWSDFTVFIVDLTLAVIGLGIAYRAPDGKPRHDLRSLLTLRFASVLLGFAALGRAGAAILDPTAQLLESAPEGLVTWGPSLALFLVLAIIAGMKINKDLQKLLEEREADSRQVIDESLP
ncbi:hypothetical protein [Microbacterium sp. A93]|uniref:hypothetical protein n=1 Tax=Microbacterium sp. A93 TaxID=3450716 RepID=UPI003F4234BC